MPYKDPEKRREMGAIYHRRWRQSEKGRETLLRLRRAYYQRVGSNRAQTRARMAVSRAVTAGTLTKRPCERCGDPNVQAHHHRGYDGGAALDIVWVCVLHHRAAHGRALILPRGIYLRPEELAEALSALLDRPDGADIAAAVLDWLTEHRNSRPSRRKDVA